MYPFYNDSLLLQIQSLLPLKLETLHTIYSSLLITYFCLSAAVSYVS